MAANQCRYCHQAGDKSVGSTASVCTEEIAAIKEFLPVTNAATCKMQAFDAKHQDTLKRIWFLGDVHGDFKHVAQTLLVTEQKPRWLVFLGDVDIDHKSFREILEPLSFNFPDVKVAFIHGNHDADTYDHWKMLHDCGDAIALHGCVLDLDGVRVAGLGGTFMGRIWSPPSKPSYPNKEVAMDPALCEWNNWDGKPDAQQLAAIYPDDISALGRLTADILVTHDAPSRHPQGFAVLDELARSMGVIRTFHGHHHDDRSAEYALMRENLGFDARAVAYCSITDGMGNVIHSGPAG